MFDGITLAALLRMEMPEDIKGKEIIAKTVDPFGGQHSNSGERMVAISSPVCIPSSLLHVLT